MDNLANAIILQAGWLKMGKWRGTRKDWIWYGVEATVTDILHAARLTL